ncbi:hypothetical protein CHS0354_016271 [Potamilus streckersoni]|uniref:Uncharacterized protein n=1 Tax=Potamilus streckersoni TaxID=2493646 RepID=A0AAE0RY10_9BIVA|nr:hypothetical protein CHS0354_016271 [Potamilus streckersoni]
MHIEATLDDIRKAGNIINAVKYTAWRSLDCRRPRPAECSFVKRIMTNYYLEAFRHYSVSILVGADKYLCEVNGYISFADELRKETRSASELEDIRQRILQQETSKQR